MSDEELEDSVEQEAPPKEPQAEAPAGADERAAAKEAAKFDKNAPFEPANLVADFASMESSLKAAVAEVEEQLQTRKGGEALGRAIALTAMMETIRVAIPEIVKYLNDVKRNRDQERSELNKSILEGFMEDVNKLQQSQREFQGALITYEKNPDKLQEEVNRIVDDMEDVMHEIIILGNVGDSSRSFQAWNEEDDTRMPEDKKNMNILKKMRADLEARQEARKSKT